MNFENAFNLFANNQVGFLVNSSKVVQGDMRLDSSHFVDDSNVVLKDDIRFTTLNDFIIDIEEPNLFTRIYCDKEFGVPYISSSEMSEIAPPINSRFISKTLTKNIDHYIIKRGQILVSAAGTVGSIVVATEELDGIAGTSDILRINVDAEINLGYVYTYLTSSFGANELANLAYGAIIKRVRGFQLADLKIPIIGSPEIARMNQLVTKALANRDIATAYVKQAQTKVLEVNYLPEIPIVQRDITKPVEVRFAPLSSLSHDFRLDVHYYREVYRMANTNISMGKNELKPLKCVAKRVFIPNRFNRIFVESSNGIRMIGTRNILQIRPLDFKYISSTETSAIGDLLLTEGMILLARSGSLGGTFGKVCFVRNNYVGYAGSEDIIRICPKDNIDSGYLFAYLSSDYGYNSIVQLRHGALIDHIAPDDLSNIPIPIPTLSQQNEIGDLIRKAYDLRAEAILLEDEAQSILQKAITK